jgi:hypothetical protein
VDWLNDEFGFTTKRHSYIASSNQCSSLFKLFFDSQHRYEINECFIFLETPIKEQKVLRFKVKVDIVVLFQ